MERLDKYTFTIHEFDKNNVITITMDLSTKKVTPKRAGELLKTALKDYVGKNAKYCYSVRRGDIYLDPKKDLK